MFQCPMCSKQFTLKGNLKNHVVSHTKEKPHKCSTCSAAFGLFASLKKHIKVVHEGVQARTHIQEKNFKCPMCNYKCINRHMLEIHLRKHSAELPFSCAIPGCEFKTKYERNLPQHVQRMHSDERPHECKTKGCNYKTNSVSNLNRHLRVHTNGKPFVCKFPGCNVACKYKSSLERHSYMIHCNEKPFRCSTCDFRAKLKSDLLQHENVHMNIRRFQCPVPKCSFSCHRHYNLQLHLNCKHRKKDVMCTVSGCKFKCATLRQLRRHSEKHVLPILQCPDNFCNYRTRLLRVLVLHVSRQHKHMQSDKFKAQAQAGAVEALICPFRGCEYQTEFQHRYDRHMKANHKEKRKHGCKFCLCRFNTPWQLERHVQRHIGEKPYSCSCCEYTTRSYQELRLHAGRIHRIHVIPCGKKSLYLNKCRRCDMKSSSYTEFVLHSMSHLQAVVVLQRLNMHFM